jgi:hypothetical protein
MLLNGNNISGDDGNAAIENSIVNIIPPSLLNVGSVPISLLTVKNNEKHNSKI